MAPLHTARVGRATYHFRQIGSTMPVADDFAGHGAPDGTAIIADEQTAGRGRRGRVWTAPPGTALLCSLICRVPLRPERLFLLTAAISLGLIQAVKHATNLEARVKWPNDLVLRGKKFAGMLSTTRLRDTTLDYAIVGFGLNVNVDIARLPEAVDGAIPPTSLALELGCDVDRGNLMRLALQTVDEYYDLLWRGQYQMILEEWRACLAGVGERVRIVTTGHEVRRGTLTGVDADGALLLVTPSGPERHLVGDLELGPRPDVAR